MRLLIVSHTPHYQGGEGIVGWGATIREIDQLSSLFESIVHVAPLYEEKAPASSMAYTSSRVRVRCVKPAGGEGLKAKLSIPLMYPSYAMAIVEEMKQADVMHVRAPANISLLALGLMVLIRKPSTRWVKFAGDWSGSENEALSYKIQRWLMKSGLQGGVVTVNGRWAGQPAFVHSFLNPCLTDAEVQEGVVATSVKRLGTRINLLFVGRLETAKGVGICIGIAKELVSRGIDCELDLIGDGPERRQFESLARELQIESQVKFHGGLPRDQLGCFFSKAHFLLLPSRSEGWPKVLSEAMAYGAVPLSTRVSSIPQFLEEFKTGAALDSFNEQDFSDQIHLYVRNPTRWSIESNRACEAAAQFSYSAYLKRVRFILGM